jgi:MoaA/NifB/PqqE/SkfB family radical SAM enzyme
MTTEADGPWRITFDTNPDDCNLRCVMCEDHSLFSTTQRTRLLQGKAPRRMDVALIRQVVSEAASHGLREIIPSTMGEPLLYSDFDEILRVCADYGVRLNLTTNGTFPRRSVEEWARLIAPVGSDVKVSLNGARPETDERIMLGAHFKRILDNVRRFIRVRNEVEQTSGHHCNVTLQATFLESNFQELPEMIRLATELGVDRVKGHHLWVHFPQIAALSMRRDKGTIERWNKVVAEVERATERYVKADGRKVVVEGVFRLDPDSDEIVPDGQCPFLGQEAWVASDGRFNPCCAPDAARRTLGDFGNLYRSRLIEIWQGNDYLNLVRTYRDRPLCRSCNMRRRSAGPAEHCAPLVS